MPELADAMENPDIGWTKVRQVARVASPDTVDRWLDAAANFTSRELEAATRGVAPGDDAPHPEDRPRLESRTITFTVSPEMEDTLTRALSFRRATLGEGAEDLSHEQVLWMIIEQSMVADATEVEVAVPRIQTIIQVCPSCDDAAQVGLPDGATAEVSEATRARARCDSVQVDMRPGKEGRSRQTVSAATRRFVAARDGHQCAAPKCRHRGWLEIHHVVHQSERVDHRPGNLIYLCSSHHQLHHDGYFNIELDAHGNPVFDFPDLSGPAGHERQALNAYA
ncbi:MAG: hypothetical protein ACI9OJ_003050 [Myxococcota bacterium]|jgi:hypothetical protein